ncbi:hypothetical protein IQ273_22300 [Nodosilinea sp. LEGE 07298]|uniref:hypothetical protein n=1 Tax=Nodosilinea sp. LEGE 07298 TaxID=2777970 RepID=UPI001880B36E|nr:hypothetical protein [Nodosilinea sp. LEGE 07298]MBE9112140.1 hypothetical protein [Nodosilinea sp. LEGE 07298]
MGRPAYASSSTQANQPEKINLVIYNQGMLNQVNIQLDYVIGDGSEYPSRRELLSTAVAAIDQYPDQNQYWEVLNRSTTQALIQKYPNIQYLSLSLEVSPRPTIPYTCTSTVTRWRNGSVQENWSFIATDIPWRSEAIDIQIGYRYQESTNYPDFLDIRDRLIAYVSSLDDSNLSVEQLEIALAYRLRQDYIDNFAELTVGISN